MNAFWGGLGEHLRECGRDATLFLLSLAGLSGLMILLAWVMETSLHDALAYVVPVGFFFFAVWWVVAIRQAIVRGRQRMNFPRLSHDEMIKARSKLKTGMKPVRRPAPRAPDTYLKY